MRKLTETLEFVCESEQEAQELVEHFREESSKEGYTIAENGYKYKAKKLKKEIVDEKWILKVKKIIGDVWDE